MLDWSTRDRFLQKIQIAINLHFVGHPVYILLVMYIYLVCCYVFFKIKGFKKTFDSQQQQKIPGLDLQDEATL